MTILCTRITQLSVGVSARTTSFISAAVLMATFAVIAALPQIILAQLPEPDDTTPQPILLQHADSLVGTMTTQGMVRELVGNVVFTQGSVNVSCDKAIHFMQQNRVDLIGKVSVSQGTMLMKAPRGSYDGNSRLMYGTQGVYLQDRNTILTAGEGFYSTNLKIARFYKTVRIETDSLVITADTLEFHRSTQNSYATGKVRAAGKYTSVLLEGDSLINIPERRYTRVSCTGAFSSADSLALPPTHNTQTLLSTTAQKPLRQAMISQIDTVEIERSETESATTGTRTDALSGSISDTTSVISSAFPLLSQRLSKQSAVQEPLSAQPPPMKQMSSRTTPPLGSKQHAANRLNSSQQLDTSTLSTRRTTGHTIRRTIRLDTLCIVGNVLEAFRSANEAEAATNATARLHMTQATTSVLSAASQTLTVATTHTLTISSSQATTSVSSAGATRELYIATGNVKLTRGSGKNSIAARAGQGIYDKERNIIWALYTPVLWIDSTQLRGDSVVIAISNKRIERITARGRAFAATKSDSTRPDRIDQLSGDVIRIVLERDTVRTLSADGNAFNLYFLTAEDESQRGKKRADGAARNAADSILIRFDGGEPDEIIWLGKVEGEHIPERLAKTMLSELKLKGFQWFDNRPRLQRGHLETEISPPGRSLQPNNPLQSKRNKKQLFR